MKSFVRHALVILIGNCFGLAAYAAERDIAGLELGMSPEQAKAALVAHGIAPDRIQESKASFRYGDGVNSHSTEEYLDYIVADKVEKRNGQRVVDNFNLYFAPPPNGGQLVMVRRQIDNPIDPPTASEYRTAILDKYGKPDDEKSGRFLWLDPGNGLNCTGNAPENVSAILSSIYMGSDKTGWRLHQLRNGNKVREPAQCARVLQYTMPSSPKQPAKRVIAVMTDVPGWGKAYLDTLAWIEGKREAAVKAREGNASKPKL